MTHSSMDLSPSVQASLATRQYISTVNEVANGNCRIVVYMYVYMYMYVRRCTGFFKYESCAVVFMSEKGVRREMKGGREGGRETEEKEREIKGRG